MSFLRTFIIFIKLVLRSFSYALGMLEYSGPTVLDQLGSDGYILPSIAFIDRFLKLALRYLCLGLLYIYLLISVVLSLYFCFLFGFSESVLAECCLFYWAAQLVCSGVNVCQRWRQREEEDGEVVCYITMGEF